MLPSNAPDQTAIDRPEPAIDRALDDVRAAMNKPLYGTSAEEILELNRCLTKASQRIAELEHERDHLRLDVNSVLTERDKMRAELRQTEKSEKDTRAQFADLKERLHAAESSNGFMRGYLARVQEDDGVREELVTVGDPDGETHLVPKRKSTAFPRPSDYAHLAADDGLRGGSGYWNPPDSERRKPKHWITY